MVVGQSRAIRKSPPPQRFPRYGRIFRESSTLWKIPRMRDHTVENEALVAWTSRSAHLPVLLHGFFCSAHPAGTPTGKPSPFRSLSSPLFFHEFLSSNSFSSFSAFLIRAVPTTAGKRVIRGGLNPFGCGYAALCSSVFIRGWLLVIVRSRTARRPSLQNPSSCLCVLA